MAESLTQNWTGGGSETVRFARLGTHTAHFATYMGDRQHGAANARASQRRVYIWAVTGHIEARLELDQQIWEGETRMECACAVKSCRKPYAHVLRAVEWWW